MCAQKYVVPRTTTNGVSLQSFTAETLQLPNNSYGTGKRVLVYRFRFYENTIHLP
jgi:hypothetical protein